MTLERVRTALLAVVAIAVVGVVLVQVGLLPGPWTVDDGEVRVVSGDADEGEAKAVVDVAVADTPWERYTGLSDHDSLEAGEGMLFVHDEEGDRTYVMREMAFDIDIVFIGADREITAIRHARAPGPDEDGEELRYSGRAKWVLEVPRGYANETGIEVGDEVEIDLESSRTILGEAGPDAVASTDRAATASAATGAPLFRFVANPYWRRPPKWSR